MDRFDAMVVFLAVVDEGSLAAAARRLRRSPAAITRAVAFLELRAGTQLLHRTTRVVRLTEAGRRYLVVCRRIVADLAEAERAAAGELATPRGVLTVTAPATFGRMHVRPVVDAFLADRLEVSARLLLLDRTVNLVDEGVDVAVRIGHLPDSSLIAVKVGDVRRVTCASPAYLARRGRPAAPDALTAHDCVSFTQSASSDAWTFVTGVGRRAKSVKVRARLAVNAAEAAVASAVEGRGVTRVLSYQIEDELRDGRLVRLLTAFEPEPLPVHLVYPAAEFTAGKVRAFLLAAAPALKATLARIAAMPARGAGRRPRS